MQYKYNTKGTCSAQIIIDVDDDKVTNVQFVGGCNGNLKGIASLVKGMTVNQVIEKLQGIKCGFKPTSSPDQLATALIQIKEGK